MIAAHGKFDLLNSLVQQLDTLALALPLGITNRDLLTLL